MKKNVSKILLLLICTVIFVGCKKSQKDEDLLLVESQPKLESLRQKVMTEVLIMLQKKEFKDFVLEQALLQTDGDYNVYLKDVIQRFKKDPSFSHEISNLEVLVPQIKLICNDREPIIFYPKAETIEKQRNSINFSTEHSNFNEEIIGVYKDVYNADFSTAGYRLDNNGNLVFKKM